MGRSFTGAPTSAPAASSRDPPVSSPASAPPAPRIASLDQHIEVETPELVAFSYSIAGIGSRGVAAMIDVLVMMVAGLVLVFIVSMGVPWVTRLGLRGPVVAMGPWLAAAMILGLFAFVWGYYVLLEVFWDGQTPGKRLMHVRVVRDGGFSMNFGASAIRNLVRIVDFLPATYGVGVASMALTREGKRLGDLVAGTIVVRERMVTVPSHAAALARASSPAAVPTISATLTEDEYVLLERFLARRSSLDPTRALAMMDQLATRFRARLDAGDHPTLDLLLRLYDRERRAREAGVAARGETGAAREQHAIVARGAARWSAFAARVSDVRRRGLRRLPEAEVTQFAAEYRAVTTDLARLKTAARGRALDSEFYLSRLVASAHNLFYRHTPLTPRAVGHFFARTVPAEVRRSRLPIGIAAILLFVPMAASYRATARDAVLARRILGDGMIQRAEDGARRARAGNAEYIDVQDFMRPVMASGIIANNVQITFVTFAGGATAGWLTLRMLVANGISIGAGLGLYSHYGIANQMLTFVAPHGVLELSAITIAGGAGLLIASAILLPGALTRREALVARGRRAITLIGCSTLFLAVAGTLEGLVSPNPHISHAAKFVISLVTALAIVLYLGFAGRYSAPRALISK